MMHTPDTAGIGALHTHPNMRHSPNRLHGLPSLLATVIIFKAMPLRMFLVDYTNAPGKGSQ